MGKIVGRSDDMLIIRGVNLFPTQVEELVLQEKGLGGQYQLVVTRDGHLDELMIRCELALGAFDDGIGKRLAERIKNLIGVTATVQVEPNNSIERTLVGKARRVVDQRKKQGA
jgi:phenylacetate-CoA ligase